MTDTTETETPPPPPWCPYCQNARAVEDHPDLGWICAFCRGRGRQCIVTGCERTAPPGRHRCAPCQEDTDRRRGGPPPPAQTIAEAFHRDGRPRREPCPTCHGTGSVPIPGPDR